MRFIETLVEKRSASPRRVWLETAAVTLMIPLVGWAVDSADPFFLKGFPWVVLAPILLGLQNGFRAALVSGALLLAGALAFWKQGYSQVASFPIDYAVSVGILGPLAGEYRDAWQRRLDATARENRSRGHDLARFTRAYHLLKRSHDDLEQRLAGAGPSLQAALDRLESVLREKADPIAAGDGILQLFGQYGRVQVASLHEVRPHADTATDAADWRAEDHAIATAPSAEFGQGAAIDPEHPMIRDALETGELTSVRDDRAASRGPVPLACVPLVDATGRVHALVMVHEMPFMAVTEENLTLLAVLGGRVGDWLAGGRDRPAEET